MKIAIIEPLGVAQSVLKEKIIAAIGNKHETVFYDDRLEDDASLVARCCDAEIVVLSNIPFRANVIKQCPKLQKICVAFTGIDHIDTEYCAAHHIEIKNCAGYSTVAVADTVFGLLLSIARNLPACDAACRAGETKNGLIGFELAGKKFGIIGFGNIGKRVATIAQAFGCQVFVYTRHPQACEGVSFVDMPVLLQTCDIISLHVPFNSQTKAMIGKKEIAMMKKTAILINTARGGVVDTEALVEALQQNKIAAAGIDVFDTEPPLDTEMPLLKLKNVALTPHIGFATWQAFEKRADIIAANLADWCR
ncbi:MAG: NAD(P)-dependent oxidoreductase [Bacteroidales bacterium]|jgi:phosphoglycerate dehydrogenase-like enzyme|nr:NAD(P)-binding domain-containing protein [Bacteroidales bacterium]MDD4394636.1 NAD(P)-dependent oxidoreductase [Bacteroidales bacterium]